LKECDVDVRVKDPLRDLINPVEDNDDNNLQILCLVTTIMAFGSISTLIKSAAIVLAFLIHRSMSFQRAGRISRLAFSQRQAQRRRPFDSPRVSPKFLWSALGATKEEVDPGIVEGTDLRVLKYPHPALRAPNALITDDELADGSIAKLAKEMFLVMYAAEGIGLAAPQVGVNKRLMVYNESGDRTKWLDEVVLVNPTVTEVSDTVDIEIEGCLSFPDMNGLVQRSKWIKVEALSLKGKKIKKKYKGWEARIFQHEYDHLDGVVYIDRLQEESKATVQPKLMELIESFDTSSGAQPAL
jgi:peptide deformylase